MELREKIARVISRVEQETYEDQADAVIKALNLTEEKLADIIGNFFDGTTAEYVCEASWISDKTLAKAILEEISK